MQIIPYNASPINLINHFHSKVVLMEKPIHYSKDLNKLCSLKLRIFPAIPTPSSHIASLCFPYRIGALLRRISCSVTLWVWQGTHCRDLYATVQGTKRLCIVGLWSSAAFGALFLWWIPNFWLCIVTCVHFFCGRPFCTVLNLSSLMWESWRTWQS